MTALRDALRARLLEARRARDSAAVSVLRAAVAALENAEAIPVGESPSAASPGSASEHVAGAVVGLGGSEAERRVLSETDERAIISSEIEDLRRSEGEYRAAGAAGRADELADGARVLSQVLSEL